METVNFNNQTLASDDPTIAMKDNTLDFTGLVAVDPLNLLNGLALTQNLLLQPITWTFSQPVSEVSFNGDMVNLLGSATINYFDENGNLLHSTATSGIGDQAYTYSSSDIAKVEIDGSGLSAFTVDSISYQDATPIVATVSNPLSNPLISGFKWGSTHLTYSLPASSGEYTTGGYQTVNGFQPLTGAETAEVQQAMANIADIAGLTLTQTTGSSADLRFAQATGIDSNDGSGLQTIAGSKVYAPGASASPVSVGDTWIQAGVSPSYTEVLKDAAEALGLQTGSLGGSHDSIAYSVMSNDTYPGGSPADLSTVDSPSTLMQDDIAALQAIYGADFNLNSGNTVYTWNPTTGEESINGVGQGAPADGKIFMTLWDGGGNDTLDFSASTNRVHVDLRPGDWTTSNPSQLANLGDGHLAPGNIAMSQLYQGNTQSLIENATGGAGDDFIFGNAANNVLTGGAGNDDLHGSAGNDTLIGGAGADYLVGGSGSDTYVYNQASDSTGTDFDTIKSFGSVDKFQFWFQVTGVDHDVHGALSAGSFDSDLAAATQNLQAHHAELFHATSGTYAGDTFLIVDANGQAGYQAGSDVVIRLDNIVHAHHLSVSDFTTS
jgi:serralysin